MDMLTIAVWAIFFGIVCAIIYTKYQAKVMSEFIEKLVSTNSFDESSSKDFEQLGITNAFSCKFIKSRIQTNFGLSRAIVAIPKQKESDDSNNQLSLVKHQTSYKYYMIQDQTENVKDKFKKDAFPFWKSALLILVLFIITCFAVTIINMLSSYSKSVFSKPENTQNVTQEHNQEDQNIIDNSNNENFDENEIQSDSENETETGASNNETTQDESPNYVQPVIPTPEIK